MTAPNLGDAAICVNEIQIALAQQNFSIPQILFDGEFHRFDRLSKLSGWYVARHVHADIGTIPIVIAGDWVTGEKHKFLPKKEWTTNQKDHIHRQIQLAQEQEGKRRDERNICAAQLAKELWEMAEPKRISPYMQKKGFVSNYGCRVDKDGVLLIPTFYGKEVWGMEKIFADGTKRYLPGQRMKGCYYSIGHLAKTSKAFLVEGFATGVSIHEATGLPVIIAFSAGNIGDVCRQFPAFNITIASDNDRFTEGNPGIAAAQKAALANGFQWLAPDFTGCSQEEGTDFNDLHKMAGLDVVRKQLEGSVAEVVDIRSKVAGKKPKKKMSDVYRAISEAMQGRNVDPVPAFPLRFHIIEPSPGARLIAQEIEPEVLQYVSEKTVTQAILKYVHYSYLLRTQEAVGFEHRHASDCMKFWRDIGDPIPEPKMVSWPGEPGYTLRRLPWALQEGDTPLFDEMMERTSNSHALKCFIGSLFFNDADLHQYVWIFGLGQNGKGALGRFLRRALKSAYSSQMVPTLGDKFWTSGLIGARLVVFPDCNNRTFPASGLFKSLTGGDPIKVEQKGMQPFTAELKAKYIYLSNEKPYLSSEMADLRRIIYCVMQTIKGMPRAGYEDELWLEGGAFLASCFRCYAEACPKHGPIQNANVDQNLNDWVSTLEEDFELAAKNHFRLGVQFECSPSDFQKKLTLIWKEDKKTQHEFRAWLERQHGVRKKTSRKHGDAKIYSGVAVIGYSSVLPINADGTADGMRTPGADV